MKPIAGVLVAYICSLLLTQAQAASISWFNLTNEYRWGVYADADINGTHFVESDITPITSAPVGIYGGSVDSPEPNKVYDTSPVSFQQPDGSFDTNISFETPWIFADASVDSSISSGSNPGTLSTRLVSTSVSESWNSPVWVTGVGQSDAFSDVWLSTRFSVLRDNGDGDTFSLDIEYFDSIIVEALANVSTPQIWDFLSIESGVLLRNETTSETLLDFDYKYINNPVVPGTALSPPRFLGSFDDLHFGDQYFFSIYLSTSAFSSSTYEIIFEDPACDVTVETCIIEGFQYDNMRARAAAAIDIDLNAYSAQIPSPIPLPAAVWFFSTALVGLFGFSRWRRSA